MFGIRLIGYSLFLVSIREKGVKKLILFAHTRPCLNMMLQSRMIEHDVAVGAWDLTMFDHELVGLVYLLDVQMFKC